MLGSSKANRLCIAIVGSSAIALGACQSTSKSGTTGHTDSSHLAYFDDKIGATDESPVALAILGPIGVQLGLDLAEWLIRGQADKFAATYGDSNRIAVRGISPPSSPPFGNHGTMDRGGVFLFARIVEVGDATDEDVLALPRLDKEGVTSIATTISKEESSLSIAEVVSYFEAMEASERHVLGLCVVGHVRPLESSDAFEIRVVGHTYPLLKSRATNTGVRSFDSVESQLILKLDGPSTGLLAEESFSASHAFPIKWDAKSATDYTFTWMKGAPIRSSPILSPRYQDFIFSAMVVESSGFKKVLEKAADEIGKIDAGGLLGQ